MSKHDHTKAGGHRHDERRRQFEQTTARRRRRMTPLVVMSALTVILAATLLYVMASGRGSGPGEAQAVAAAGQDLSFPVAQFDDGVARFYRQTTADGREVRFFVMKSSDGVIRAAFDACDTCWEARLGYHQQGDVMVCKKCKRTFPSNDINVLQGGCNPAPLNRTIVDGRVVLTAAALRAGTGYF